MTIHSSVFSAPVFVCRGILDRIRSFLRCRHQRILHRMSVRRRRRRPSLCFGNPRVCCRKGSLKECEGGRTSSEKGPNLKKVVLRTFSNGPKGLRPNPEGWKSLRDKDSSDSCRTKVLIKDKEVLPAGRGGNFSSPTWKEGPLLDSEDIPGANPTDSEGSPGQCQADDEGADDSYSESSVRRRPPMPCPRRAAPPKKVPKQRRPWEYTNGEQLRWEEEFGDLAKESFFHVVSRAEAKDLLHGASDGTYLVRPSSHAGCPFALCLRHSSKTYNINIRRREEDGLYALGYKRNQEKTYQSVKEMIATLQKEQLALKTGKLWFRKLDNWRFIGGRANTIH